MQLSLMIKSVNDEHQIYSRIADELDKLITQAQTSKRVRDKESMTRALQAAHNVATLTQMEIEDEYESKR